MIQNELNQKEKMKKESQNQGWRQIVKLREISLNEYLTESY